MMADGAVTAVVLVRVGTGVWAAPVDRVREVLPPRRATRVPGVDPAVLGLVNVRGGLVTLLDLHRLLGVAPDGEAEGAILVVTLGLRRYALLCSEVLDFLEAAPADRPVLDLDHLLAPACGAAAGPAAPSMPEGTP